MTSIAIVNSTINVPFHGAELFVINHNGEPYTPMKPIVEGMGMDWMGQYTKLKQRFTSTIEEISMVAADGKTRSMICLALRKLSAWLNTISPNKVRPEIRERVIQYQEECDDVLYEYWTKGQVTNPRKADSAPGKITPEQQIAIKELVMSRGHALPKEKQAKAMITMWSAIKNKFGSTYKEIDGDKFTEALSLVARLPLEGELLEREIPEQVMMVPSLPSSPDISGKVLYTYEHGRIIDVRVAREDEHLISAKSMMELLQMRGYVISTKEELTAKVMGALKNLQ